MLGTYVRRCFLTNRERRAGDSKQVVYIKVIMDEISPRRSSTTERVVMIAPLSSGREVGITLIDYPRRREYHRISASQTALMIKQTSSPYLPLLTSTTRIALKDAKAVEEATPISFPPPSHKSSLLRQFNSSSFLFKPALPNLLDLIKLNHPRDGLILQFINRLLESSRLGPGHLAPK